jgi:hypothetical protein
VIWRMLSRRMAIRLASSIDESELRSVRLMVSSLVSSLLRPPCARPLVDRALAKNQCIITCAGRQFHPVVAERRGTVWTP